MATSNTTLHEYRVPAHPTTDEFKKILGLEILTGSANTTAAKTCRIFLAQHGSTSWSEEKRLQGHHQVPLSDKGREEAKNLAQNLAHENIAAIYSSASMSAEETCSYISKATGASVALFNELRGEYHGAFEGYTKAQYMKEPHFKFYYELSPEEELFFPCGKDGESKANMVLRVIPKIKELAKKHLGQTIMIVTHGGLFKVLNFYLGNYSQEEGTKGIPYGATMTVFADAKKIYLDPELINGKK